ncbi:MAG: transglutaminase family protein [Pseudomonadota bacterium]
MMTRYFLCCSRPVVRFSVLFATLALSMPVVQAAADDGRERSRAEYGQSEASFWSPLTDFERDTIERYPIAEQGDPDALLALYLMASGDIRSRAAFREFRRSIGDRAPETEGGMGARQTGEYLLETMFQHFLGGEARLDDPLEAYDAGQSQLSTLLGSGRYNCISSSLLYIVLARRAGLEANGVILPSHAFVDITLPDGQVLSVETTSPEGFGIEHDQAWFDGNDEQWFEARDLEVPRYEDYQARQRVSAAELGLENMWNQHAARLPYADRLRLAELQSHLRPSSLPAQMNRMIYYSREIEWILERDDTETLQRFMRQTAPWRDHMLTMLEEEGQDPDQEFQGLWYWLEVQRAAALIASGAARQGAEQALNVLESVSSATPEVQTIRHNAHVVLDDYMQQVTGADDLEHARKQLSRLPALCEGAELCMQALARLHSGLAAVDWEQGDWDEALGHFREYLAMPGSDAFRPSIEQNMEGAWLNWAEQNWYDEFRDQAMEHLRRCVNALEQAPRCQRRLEEYRAQRF